MNTIFLRIIVVLLVSVVLINTYLMSLSLTWSLPAAANQAMKIENPIKLTPSNSSRSSVNAHFYAISSAKTATSTVKVLSETGFKSIESKIIPIVYVFFSDQLNDDHYQWNTIRAGLFFKNNIIFIAGKGIHIPSDILGKIELVDFQSLETERLKSFRKLYTITSGKTLREPWERQNMERFFILYELMEIKNMSYVFYADSDVVVNTRLELNLLKTQKCESMLSLVPEQKWTDMLWVAWAGTSILQKSMLIDFLEWAPNMYMPKPFQLLETKFTKQPYICDMNLWYLFLAKNGKYLNIPL